ncbi:MAG: MerR family transcriptional regulator [Clostridia bacterium]|nr:MerR family transcriptional regulator [Clostridia bacterium]
MKINEVESLVGIPKKNIRYYEDEGLLNPARDSANGYRNYTDEDVTLLKKIKVYRKLALPIEEIQNIMTGKLTVSEALERHKIFLAHQKTDIEKQLILCDQMIRDAAEDNTLDADAYLSRILNLEREGVTFTNIVKLDRKKEITGVWLSVAGFALLFLAIAGFFLWGFIRDPAPLWVLIIFEAAMILPAIGVLIAGFTRIKEINGGEEDDLSQY